MISILLVAVAGALVVFSIVVKARAGKRKKAERWEKAEIVKRLLALSDRENTIKGISGPKPVVRTPAPRPRAAAGQRAVSL